MTTITVEVDKEKDLPALKALFSRLGLKYKIEENEWIGLSEAEITGIEAGLKDVEARRVYSHADVSKIINEKINRLGTKNEG
ncbi:hypothetical protein [Pedobacter cryophilus]|uniref:Uncharacterized protein n=1 Tax=Pedobacter cryophilus TaxID=2571271 RepID=A0A4U1C1E0_9SPHI|nr:hypothetical protein [Pedobacter cryophilus]TKB97703.1 hypothetical protein FA046_10080 [Pedobacter cryophilus]